MRVPKHMWVLIDQSNGDAGYNDGGRNYLFWFFTRKAARAFLKDHMTKLHHSDLSNPQKYFLDA